MRNGLRLNPDKIMRLSDLICRQIWCCCMIGWSDYFSWRHTVRKQLSSQGFCWRLGSQYSAPRLLRQRGWISGSITLYAFCHLLEVILFGGSLIIPSQEIRLKFLEDWLSFLVISMVAFFFPLAWFNIDLSEMLILVFCFPIGLDFVSQISSKMDARSLQNFPGRIAASKCNDCKEIYVFSGNFYIE